MKSIKGYIFGFLLLFRALVCTLDAMGSSNSRNLSEKWFHIRDYSVLLSVNDSSKHISIVEKFSDFRWMMVNLNGCEIDLQGTIALFRLNSKYSVIHIPRKVHEIYFNDENESRMEILPINSFKLYNKSNDSSFVYIIKNKAIHENKELFIHEFVYDKDGIFQPNMYGVYSFNLNGWLYSNIRYYLSYICFENLRIEKIK